MSIANSLVENYVEQLRDKFPSCSIVQFSLEDKVVVNVQWKDKENWFEVPVMFSTNISAEQFNSAKTDLGKWESEISARLSNKEGLLSNKI